MGKRKCTDKFRARLEEEAFTLAETVKDSCLLYMRHKMLCVACNRYLAQLTLNPRAILELPSGKLITPIPKCTEDHT